MNVYDESVSIVIPVFNERPVIEIVIRDLLAHVVEAVPGSEIVAVDDCSTDGTLAELRAIAAEDPRVQVIAADRNRGHGPALMTGLSAATKPWLFLVDADGQIPPPAFRQLWARRAGADLIMGRREARRDSRHRVILSRVLEKVVGRVARDEIPDPNVPFKLLRRDVWIDLRSHVDDNSRVPSLLIAVGAALRGWSRVSVTVDHLPRPHGRSKLRGGRLLRLGSGALHELLSFRARLNRAAPRSPNDRQPETPPATLTK